MINSNEIYKRLQKSIDNPNDKDPFLIIPNPDLKKLKKSGSSSIDLNLGTWFVTLREARMSHLETKTEQQKLTKTHYVPFGKEFYLHPSTFVLGITLEWLRLPKDLSGYLIGKSSWGRRGLIIATAAGVHPGFKGCLTLEMCNVGQIPIEIRPGMEIGQLFLHEIHGKKSDIKPSQFIANRKPTLGDVEPKPGSLAAILVTKNNADEINIKGT